MIKIKKGLDLPITGSPKQEITQFKNVEHVAIIGDDFHGMKPTMLVKPEDTVKKGQALFSDKKNPGVVFTSPVSGVIEAVNRGDKRHFESIVIKQVGNEKVTFKNFNNKSASDLTREEVVALLVESGEWTGIRTRPFSKSPLIDSKPSALFINGMDTNPLAPASELWISKYKDDFVHGINILSKLTEGITYVCLKAGHNHKLDIPNVNVKVESFSGPHPAGNTGVHIHHLSPASANKTVWSIGYQDVIAVGKLFQTGELFSERLISVAGPEVLSPKVVETLRGASIDELIQGNVSTKEVRVISGSVFSGRKSRVNYNFLGKFHNQISIIEEYRTREFLGWQSPGFNKFSVTRVFLSKLFPGKKFNFTTSTNGSPRAIVPIGSFEKVMPFDMEPTYFLRSLMGGDLETVQKLGIFELDEEDIALCSFVDPGKNNFGPALRCALETIEKEG